MSNSRVVLVFGTFDLLHPGHRWFLRQAAKLGDTLTVVVARDRVASKLKGHLPWWSEQRRLKVVRHLAYVDQVRLGNLRLPHRLAMVRKLKPDLLVLGYDQGGTVTALRRSLKRLGLKTKVVRLKPFHPERYKSSLLKKI